MDTQAIYSYSFFCFFHTGGPLLEAMVDLIYAVLRESIMKEIYKFKSA